MGQRRQRKATYAELVREIFGARADEALRWYPGGSPDLDKSSARALGGDLTIIHSTWAWIEAQKAHGRSEIFRFRFDRAPLTPQGWFGERDSREAGAFHAGEILYVFDNLDAFPWLIEDSDRALATLASSYSFDWETLASEDPRVLAFFAAAAKYGVGRNGLSIPVRNRRGEL